MAGLNTHQKFWHGSDLCGCGGSKLRWQIPLNAWMHTSKTLPGGVVVLDQQQVRAETCIRHEGRAKAIRCSNEMAKRTVEKRALVALFTVVTPQRRRQEFVDLSGVKRVVF